MGLGTKTRAGEGQQQFSSKWVMSWKLTVRSWRLESVVTTQESWVLLLDTITKLVKTSVCSSDL
jgi:hypothetical protein